MAKESKEVKDKKESKTTAVKTTAKTESKTEIKAKVIRLGWENENPSIPIALIGKKQRQQLNVKLGDIVKIVKEGNDTEISVIGIVERQFKDLIKDKNVATANTKLQNDLSLKLGDIIKISKEVTETQAHQFQQNAQRNSQQMIMRLLTGRA